jgi:hypothetical protein
MWLFASVGCIFWYSEWQYNLPTPIPSGYRDVLPGTYIPLTNPLLKTKQGPLLIHFFNPDCPCSKFNLAYFKKIVAQYNSSLNFALVLVGSKIQYTPQSIQQQFGLSIPVFIDSNIARLCGVYATPQAVLLTASNLLYYRGNYNKSRYCVSPGSEYAKMAIDSLLAIKQPPAFNRFAFTAYGCAVPIPNNTLMSIH